MSAATTARRALASVTGALGLRSAIGTAIGAVFAAAKVPPPGLRHGRVEPPGDPDERPVAIVVLLGASADAVARTATVLADLAAGGGAGEGLPPLRPLVLLDTPHFAALRREGLPFDHVPPRESWPRRGGGTDYDAHLAWRMRLLRRQYATSTVLTLPPDGVDAVPRAQLLAELAPAGASRAAVVRRRVVAAVERRVDAPSR